MTLSASRFRVAALGYCLEHKADVVPDWQAALGS